MGCCYSIENHIQNIYIDFYVYLTCVYPNIFFGKNDIQKYNNFINTLKNIIKQNKSCVVKYNKRTKFVYDFLTQHHKEFKNLLMNNKNYQKYILQM